MAEEKKSPQWRQILARTALAGSALLPQAEAGAQPAEAPRQVTAAKEQHVASPQEQQVVARGIQMIRDSQLENGAFNMRQERQVTPKEPVEPANPTPEQKAAYEKEKAAFDTVMDNLTPRQLGDRAQAEESGDDPSQRVVKTIRVIPYFANHSALALLSAYERQSHDIKDMERVAKWLQFSVSHQEQDSGYIADFKGQLTTQTNGKDANGTPILKIIRNEKNELKADSFEKAETMDSVDSYASTFLQVAERYLKNLQALPEAEQQALNGVIAPDALYKAAKLSLKALKSVTQEDGLSFAKPDYEVKLLMDNIEAYGGLVAANRYFERVAAEPGKAGEAGALAQEAQAMAHKLGEKLKAKAGSYWQEDEKHYAWAIMKDGKQEKGLIDNYPHALANLFAITFIEEHKGLWEELKKNFKPDDDNPPERWLMAAIAVGDPKVNEWYKAVIDSAQQFDPSINGHHVALSMLSLLDGRSWLPSVAEEAQAQAPKQGRGK